MTDINLLQLFFYLLPAVIVGLISFYFFKMHISNEEKRRLYLLRLENQKIALPIKLQAFERMSLFLERISMGKLLLRIKPKSNDLEAYEDMLVQTIDQEFDHNLAQQIYLSPECWNVIKTSKNATIGIIRKTAKKEDVSNADELRQDILNALMNQTPPTEAALDYIKKEVRNTI
jgi:Mg2+/citrate symporter